MQEVVEGVWHWSARHPRIGADVSSYLLPGSGTVIDPLLPEGEGPGWVGADVRHVVVTICLHTRSAAAFGVPIRAPRPGVHRWDGRGLDVDPYDDGDEVAPGVRAVSLAAISPDDFMLHIDAGPGALVIGDGLINYGQIGFVPDHLIGDDPEGVKLATRERLSAAVDELEFDALLFAHGTPIASGGKRALERFLAS